MTQETKQAIAQDYADRKNKVTAIAAKYGITNGRVVKIAVEQGVEPRCPKKYGQPLHGDGKIKICPKCRKRIDVKGARFCCYCGADVRSNKEKLCERLDEAIGLVQFLPQNARDDMRDVLLEAIKELKG